MAGTVNSISTNNRLVGVLSEDNLLVGELSTGPSSGTLKDYVKFTDYATTDKTGVIRINSAYGTAITTNGALCGNVNSYSVYQQRDGTYLISKGTLENVIIGKDLTTKTYVDELVGDIGTLIDVINGEVI